jgi:hypothetical protein
LTWTTACRRDTRSSFTTMSFVPPRPKKQDPWIGVRNPPTASSQATVWFW